MRTAKIAVVAAVAAAVIVAGVVASLLIQHRNEASIRENAEVLGRQDIQLAGLTAGHERLLRKAAETKILPADGAMHELEKLRLEAARLREQTNELGKSLAQTRGSRRFLGIPSLPPGFEYTPEAGARRQEMAAGATQDASILSKAFYDFYRAHQDHFPASLDQLAPYLAQNNLSLTGTNEFELIYPGPQDGLTNFPTQMLPVIRERQPWQAPSGRWARVYGMLTVPPRIVETDDNFQSWEADHIIPPRDDGQ